jgi:hydroxyacylglutathione hydrolase
MPEVVTIETPGLGDRSYLVHDGSQAMVVDRSGHRPGAGGGRGCRRADHPRAGDPRPQRLVTGGFALAGETGAGYLVAEDVSFSRVPVRDGDQVPAGSVSISVLYTPEHTPGTCPMSSPVTAAGPRPCSPAAACCTARSGAPT